MEVEADFLQAASQQVCQEVCHPSSSAILPTHSPPSPTLVLLCFPFVLNLPVPSFPHSDFPSSKCNKLVPHYTSPSFLLLPPAHISLLLRFSFLPFPASSSVLCLPFLAPYPLPHPWLLIQQHHHHHSLYLKDLDYVSRIDTVVVSCFIMLVL